MNRIYSLLLLLFLIGFSGVSFAADPSFSLVPASGSTLKLHCNYNINLRLNAGGQVYNAFQSTLKFSTSDVTLTHGTVNAPFTDYAAGVIEGGNRYRVYGNMPAGNSQSTDVNAATFGLRTIANVLSTTLTFVDINGNPISFGSAGTADGEYIIGVNAGGADILVDAAHTTYNYVPLPCVPDTNSPLFPSTTPTNGSRFIPSNQVVSFLTYDWIGAGNVGGPSPLGTNNRQHYWYNGGATILANYVAAPATVDNQEGVNSSSLRATVTCATCSSFGGPYTLSGSALTVTAWTGDASRNQYTWDSATRGYVVSFTAPAAYEVEKQVTVQLQSTDNPNENSAVNTGTYSFSFNSPQVPTITRLLPSTSTFVSPSKANPIKFYMQDDWAGINTGSVIIYMPTIMSGATQLLTGYVYSGSDLTFVLSGGSAGTGNAGSYTVQFTPKWDLPANASISITGSVYDLAGNQGIFSTSYTTRPDCSYFGCNEILGLNILGGSSAGAYSFSGALLVVTGTNPNSPYPYLTGVNNDTIMCGLPWNGAILTGNVTILDSGSNSLNGTLYTGNKLYITGLNFTISNGVIIVQ